MSEDTVVDFPRGGAKVLTPLETRKIKDTAKNDVLFGNIEPEVKKKKKNPRKIVTDLKEATAIPNQHTVNHFSFKYLVKGMLVLGYVKEIYKTEIVIGLPNGLNGHVSITQLYHSLVPSSLYEGESSEDENEEEVEKAVAINDIFAIGQLVPVAVKGLFPSKTGYRKISLSVLPEDINVELTSSCIKPKMVLWGKIQSVEDHGYTVSLGKDKISGFVRKSSEVLNVGDLRWFCVQKTGNKKVINLAIDNEVIRKAEMSETGAHFNSLLPGQLVKVTVTDVSDDGVSGKIFDSFDAVVETIHLMQQSIGMEKLDKKRLMGRVIHVNTKTKQIGVSLAPNVVSFAENILTMKHRIGDIIEDCEVIKFENLYGLFMKLPNEEYGVVHVSRISDKHTEKISKKHKTGTQHECRVLGYSALDSSYTLSMKKTDFEKSFLRYEDLKPGMKISGEIVSLEEFGCLVKITQSIRGLCPTMHLSDIKLSHPERKFQEGKKLKFRVLYVKPEQRQLILTHKKTMLKSELPLITSVEDNTMGSVVHGFVSRIKPFGLFVNFYNEIKGLLPKSEINCSKTASLNELFFVGQVLRCTVITANKEDNKLVVSLRDQDIVPSAKRSLTRGQIICGTLENVSDDKTSLKLISNGVECSLPIPHLSDFKTIIEEWKMLNVTLEKHCVFKHCIVFGTYRKTQETVISQKQSLQSDGCKISSFQDLSVGMICCGVVSHIMPYGVFVELAPHLMGLVPISELADEYIKSPSDTFYVGQSLIVKVTEINSEKHRFLISAKPSVLTGNEENSLNSAFSGNSLLELFLQERSKLRQYALSCSNALLKSLPTLLGEIIITKIEKVSNDGVTLSYQMESGVVAEGFISSPLRYGASFEVGKECQCYVIDINISKKLFYATTNEDAISAVITRKAGGKAIQYPEEKKLDAIVASITDEIVVVMLPNQSYTIAYMSSRKHLNTPVISSRRHKLSQTILVKFIREDEKLGVMVGGIEDVDDASKVEVGSLLTGVVKGVKPTQLSLTLLNGKMHGRVHVSNIADTIEEGKCLLSKYEPMQLVNVKVLGFKDMATRTDLPITQGGSKALVELTLKPSMLQGQGDDTKEHKPIIGDTINCFVTSVTKKYIWVSITPTQKGKISLLHFSTEVKDLRKLSAVKPGFGYKAQVLGHNEEHNCVELSRIGDPAKLIAKGSTVTGRISRIMDTGLLVELPNHKAGVVNFTEISDSFKDDPFDEFSVNQLLKCYILNVKKGDQIDLSLRESRLSGMIQEEGDRVINGYDDIKDNDILRGYVKSCSKVGVFISLSSTITGRVQIKNLSQFFVKNYVDKFPVGRLVKAKILSIDPATNNIDLSLRGKDVGGPDLGTPPKRKSMDDDDEEEKEEEKKKQKLMEESSESDSECSDDEDVQMKENDSDDETEVKPCLQLSVAFDWSADVEDAVPLSDTEDSDDEEDLETNVKKTKRQKRAAKKAEEEYLHKAELALLDSKSRLESAEDFDRVILGSPDSSLVWIQYMAFHLHSAEVEKARAVAEKAIKTISYREEQEKLNVWVALLNLESMYGTSESLDKCFQNALKVNDTKKVYSKMSDIYIKCGKNEDAEKLFQVMIRKFRTSLQVWTAYGFFLMKNGQLDTARKLLQRSLKSLPQRKHIENIVKFAVMEYKMGEPNRGSTIFESILKNYPRRTDLWSIYLDMSIKEGDLEHVRNIFERAVSLVMNSKKMKFLFKRYLDFEEQYGNESTVEAVKKKALEYVEHKLVEGDE